MVYLFRLILISALFSSCTPKEVAIEKQIVGRYTLSHAQCGSDTSNFTLHTFVGFELDKDGTGLDGFQAINKPFEWAVIGNKLEICYTTSSTSIEFPFKLSGDTLILTRSNQFCPHLKAFYVRD